MLDLTCGRLDGSWITGTERKHFHIFSPSSASITIEMGAIFLITTRVNKQVILQTNAGANMWLVGWIMDYGDRKETFSYIFSL